MLHVGGGCIGNSLRKRYCRGAGSVVKEDVGVRGWRSLTTKEAELLSEDSFAHVEVTSSMEGVWCGV